MPGVGGITLNQAASLTQIPYVAGRWYWSDRGNLGAGAAQTTNTIRLNAFLVKRPITISDLFTRITTVQAAGNVQLAIYAADPVTGYPAGNALCTTASISTTTAQMVSAAIVGSGVLLPGLYWLAVNSDNSVAVLQGSAAVAAVSDGALLGSVTLANLSSAANTAALIYTIAQTFGTWPNLTAAGLTEVPGTNGTAFGFKVSVGG